MNEAVTQEAALTAQTYRRWAWQYALALPMVAAVLATVQLMKGQGMQGALLFGVFWSVVTLAVHGVVRWRNFRRNLACAMEKQ